MAAASRSPAPPHPAADAAAKEENDARTPPLWSLEGDTDGPDPALWALASGHETVGLAERLESSSSWTFRGGGRREAVGSGDGGAAACGASSSAGAGGGASWCPRRVRLRTRLGKRCRRDLAARRTEILIKATFNPLHGDSSTAEASEQAVCLFVYLVARAVFMFSYLLISCSKTKME